MSLSFQLSSPKPLRVLPLFLACLLPLCASTAQDTASAPPAVENPTTEPAPVPETAEPKAPSSETSAAQAPAQEIKSLEVITFDTAPGKLFVPLGEAAGLLGWTALCSWPKRELLLNGVVIPPADRRNLLDGTEVIDAAALIPAGAEVNFHPSGQSATITAGGRQFNLMRAEKRVEVSLGEQRLRAWQGTRLILETKISSGRNGGTPSGNFTAGPFKSRMHRSKRYHNAPMPYSVQINGHVFIHGFTSVPDYPASHGCVRVPLTGRNPARCFYEWVDPGTPVAVLPVPQKKKRPALAN